MPGMACFSLTLLDHHPHSSQVWLLACPHLRSLWWPIICACDGTDDNAELLFVFGLYLPLMPSITRTGIDRPSHHYSSSTKLNVWSRAGAGGWMDEWVGGWMSGWMVEWMGWWLNERWMGEWYIDGWIDGWMVGWVDRWIYKTLRVTRKHKVEHDPACTLRQLHSNREEKTQA